MKLPSVSEKKYTIWFDLLQKKKKKKKIYVIDILVYFNNADICDRYISLLKSKYLEHRNLDSTAKIYWPSVAF